MDKSSKYWYILFENNIDLDLDILSEIFKEYMKLHKILLHAYLFNPYNLSNNLGMKHNKYFNKYSNY